VPLPGVRSYLALLIFPFFPEIQYTTIWYELKFFKMEIQQIQGLLEQTSATFNEFKSTESETSRIQAQEQALKLARALERPRDAILKLAYTVRPIFPLQIS
jgi:archaellum component FlaC